MTLDEYKAPIVAFAYHGLGRTAVFTGQIGGEFGADVVAWDGFASFFVTLARWLAGQEAPSELLRERAARGRVAVISVVELDRSAKTTPDTSSSSHACRSRAARSCPCRSSAWPTIVEARHTLAREGVLGTIALADGRHVDRRRWRCPTARSSRAA